VAGRTDTGVHAEGQVASFAAPDGPSLDLDRLRRSLNGILGPEVAVLRARWAADGFHARFSAVGREYRYRIDTAEVPDPFAARFVWHRPGALDVGPMRRAAALLVGEHDFASFCRTPRSQGPTTRHLRALSVSSSHEIILIRAEANAFLHQMVRSLVGTLARVGERKMEADSMSGVLAARDRSAAGPIAPPHGLVLARVRYRR
jgi:tRNA pseudouridine38-40 synthase